MLKDSKAFSGFAVDDIAKAHQFYGETLGLRTETIEMGPTMLLTLHLAGDTDVMVYDKSDFVPATYTILNFRVEDVEATVDELTAKGVSFEQYEGFGQDEKGIVRGHGPTIAWFKDPAGNILSVLERP